MGKRSHRFLVHPSQTETAVNQPPSVLISPLQHVSLSQLLLFMFLMKCWMGLFFPPSLHFLEGSKMSILSFFFFLLLQFFAGVWLYVLPAADSVYGERQQQGCFVWLKEWLPSSPLHATPPPHLRLTECGDRRKCSGCPRKSLCWLLCGHQFHHILCHSILLMERFQLHLSVGWREADLLAKTSFNCFTKPVAQYDRF